MGSRYGIRDLEGDQDPLNSSVRNFVILAHRARTRPDFPLNDPCGAGGRWDAVARCINSALFLSHDIRRDTSIHLILTGAPDPPRTITIDGSRVKYLNPDERSTVSMMMKNLKIEPGASSDYHWITPGIYIRRSGLSELLQEIEGVIVHLNENGREMNPEEPEKLGPDSKRVYFILSDDRDMTPKEIDEIDREADMTLSLGDKIYHSNHAITIIHYLLDRNMI